MTCEESPGGTGGQHLVIMGIAGCGKSTVAAQVAARLGWPVIEGDDVHPPANIEKMANGVPLDDDDRLPWLNTIRALMSQDGLSAVIACSALKVAYRDILRQAGDVRFVHLSVSERSLQARLAARAGHFMKPGMLASQLTDLEGLGADEQGATIDAGLPLEGVVLAALTLARRWWPDGAANSPDWRPMSLRRSAPHRQ